MAKTENVATNAIFDFSVLRKTIALPRREVASILRLALNGTFMLSDPGSGAAGTVGGAAPAPLTPLGLIQELAIKKNPAGMQGALVFNSASLALLQNVVIPLKRRIAARTAVASGAAGTKTVYAELMLPYSLPGDKGAAATPMAGVESWDVEVNGQAAAATARDAVLTSCTMTFAYGTLNVNATIEFADALPGGPLMEIACSYDRINLDVADKKAEIKSISPGEVPILHVMQAWDNNARAALAGTVTSPAWIEASYGAGEPYYQTREAENPIEMAGRYGIPDGSMPTGCYFVDPVAVFGGIEKVPLVGASGGTPTLRFRLGSAATSPAFVDVLSIRGRWTAAGLAALAKRAS